MVNGNPATTFFDITPADGARIGTVSGIYCGGAGIVVAKDAQGNVAHFTVGAGQVLPISPRSIEAATTAQLLVGLSNNL